MRTKSLVDLISTGIVLSTVALSSIGCSNGHNPSPKPYSIPERPTTVQNWHEHKIVVPNDDWYDMWGRTSYDFINYDHVNNIYYPKNVETQLPDTTVNMIRVDGEDAIVWLSDTDPWVGTNVPEWFRYYGEDGDYELYDPRGLHGKYLEAYHAFREYDSYMQTHTQPSQIVVNRAIKAAQGVGLEPNKPWFWPGGWDIFGN